MGVWRPVTIRLAPIYMKQESTSPSINRLAKQSRPIAPGIVAEENFFVSGRAPTTWSPAAGFADPFVNKLGYFGMCQNRKMSGRDYEGCRDLPCRFLQQIGNRISRGDERRVRRVLRRSQASSHRCRPASFLTSTWRLTALSRAMITVNFASRSRFSFAGYNYRASSHLLPPASMVAICPSSPIQRWLARSPVGLKLRFPESSPFTDALGWQFRSPHGFSRDR